MVTIGIPKEIHPGEKRVAATPQTILRLKKLGFEVISRPGQAKLLIGRIASDKLNQLAALAFVQHITAR